MGNFSSFVSRGQSPGVSPSSTEESNSKVQYTEPILNENGKKTPLSNTEEKGVEEPESNDTSYGVEATAVRALAASTGTVAILATTAKSREEGGGFEEVEPEIPTTVREFEVEDKKSEIEETTEINNRKEVNITHNSLSQTHSEVEENLHDTILSDPKNKKDICSNKELEEAEEKYDSPKNELEEAEKTNILKEESLELNGISKLSVGNKSTGNLELRKEYITEKKQFIENKEEMEHCAENSLIETLSNQKVSQEELTEEKVATPELKTQNEIDDTEITAKMSEMSLTNLDRNLNTGTDLSFKFLEGDEQKPFTEEKKVVHSPELPAELEEIDNQKRLESETFSSDINQDIGKDEEREKLSELPANIEMYANDSPNATENFANMKDYNKTPLDAIILNSDNKTNIEEEEESKSISSERLQTNSVSNTSVSESFSVELEEMKESNAIIDKESDELQTNINEVNYKEKNTQLELLQVNNMEIIHSNIQQDEEEHTKIEEIKRNINIGNDTQMGLTDTMIENVKEQVEQICNEAIERVINTPTGLDDEILILNQTSRNEEHETENNRSNDNKTPHLDFPVSSSVTNLGNKTSDLEENLENINTEKHNLNNFDIEALNVDQKVINRDTFSNILNTAITNDFDAKKQILTVAANDEENNIVDLKNNGGEISSTPTFVNYQDIVPTKSINIVEEQNKCNEVYNLENEMSENINLTDDTKPDILELDNKGTMGMDDMNIMNEDKTVEESVISHHPFLTEPHQQNQYNPEMYLETNKESAPNDNALDIMKDDTGVSNEIGNYVLSDVNNESQKYDESNNEIMSEGDYLPPPPPVESLLESMKDFEKYDGDSLDLEEISEGPIIESKLGQNHQDLGNMNNINLTNTHKKTDNEEPNKEATYEREGVAEVGNLDEGLNRHSSSAKIETKEITLEEEEAAAKIQASVRGYLTRKHLKEIERGGGGEEEEKEEEGMGDERRGEGEEGGRRRRVSKSRQEAASKIQAGVRGFLVRKRQKQEREAATKIQAGFRGFKVRQQIKIKTPPPITNSTPI